MLISIYPLNDKERHRREAAQEARNGYGYDRAVRAIQYPYDIVHDQQPQRHRRERVFHVRDEYEVYLRVQREPRHDAVEDGQLVYEMMVPRQGAYGSILH